MIPKTIHYVWFGRNQKPELIEKCIASWRKYCPDWEIIEWNENNWDISRYTFAKQAYEAKKWAFVSDVARLDVVHQHGGVYLDTDVELLRPINSLLENEAFLAFETERYINTGLGFGAIPGHLGVKAMIDYYRNKKYVFGGNSKTPPCPAWNTESLIKQYPYIIRNGSTQKVWGGVFF